MTFARVTLARVFMLATLVATPLAVGIFPGTAVSAETTTPAGKSATSTDKTSTDKAGETKVADSKFTKAQIKAFLDKCSDEADTKGLFVKAGKSAQRTTFRRECMHKLGVDPK